MHEAQRVTMSWIARYGEKNFESHPQGADGHLSIVNGKITVFLEKESIEHGHFPMRVAQRLAELYGLRDPECLETINLILNSPNEEFVQKVMRKRGYVTKKPPPLQTSIRQERKDAPPTEIHDARRAAQNHSSSTQGSERTSKPANSVDKPSSRAPTKNASQQNQTTVSFPAKPVVNTVKPSDQAPTERASSETTPREIQRAPHTPKLAESTSTSSNPTPPATSSKSKDAPWQVMEIYTPQRSSKEITTERAEPVQKDPINSRIQRMLDYCIEDHNSFIVSPSIPDRSFRDLSRNPIFAGTDSAEVVFLSDSDSTAAYRKRISAMETLPARISTDAEGFLTAFVNFKSKAQTEMIFHAELFVSKAKSRILASLISTNLQISQLLQQMQDQKYCPNIHWTSREREAAGYESFDPNIKPVATFEVVEPSAEMKHFVRKYAITEFPHPIERAKMIYLDVQAAMKDTADSLEIFPRRFEKVLNHSSV